MTLNRRGNVRQEPEDVAGPGDESAVEADDRRVWVRPRLEELPPLRELTLQTGGGVGGDESVFP